MKMLNYYFIWVSGILKLIMCTMNVFIGHPLSHQWEPAYDRLPAATVTCSVFPAYWCSTLLQETSYMRRSSSISLLFSLSLAHWKM